MLDGVVELDDFYIGARRGGAGRGTAKRPMVCCVERGRAGAGGRRGRCAIDVVPDVSGTSYRRFASGRVRRSATVRADGWQGVRGGLAGWPGLDQRPFDPADPDASLSVAHHVISNFKAMVRGTFHGLPAGSLQSAADEFSWRYSHRDGADAFADLVRDVTARLHPLALVASPPPQPLPRPSKAAVA